MTAGRGRGPQRRAVLVAVVLVILACIPVIGGRHPVVAAPGDTATPPAAVRYVQLLRQARQALPADPASARRAVEAAAPLAPDLGALSQVRAALDAGQTDRARALLDDDIAALNLPDSAQPAGPAEVDDARRRLAEVYTTAPLDSLDSAPVASGPLDVLGRLLGRILSFVLETLGTTGSLLLGGVALALIALLATLLVRRISAAGRGRAVAASGSPPGTDTDQEWALALAAAAHGDHREAVRRAYRSALLAVARGGQVPVDANTTNRELLRRLESSGILRSALLPLAGAFEMSWYGGRSTGPAEWQAARAQVEQVRRLAAGSVGARAA